MSEKLMKRLLCVEPGRFEYETVEIPKPVAGQSLIKIKKVGICGTDLHAFEGTQPFFSYPRILGHEIAAEYIEGDNGTVSKGEMVTVIPYLTAGTDIASKMGKPNCSTDMQVIGVHIDGAMSEYLIVPSSCIRKYENLLPDQLVLIEPLSIGAHALQRAKIKNDEFAVVVGAGPIGIGIVALGNALGAKMIVVDIEDSRLASAKGFGAYVTLNAKTQDVVSEIANITNGDMATLVIDATGSLIAIENAFNYLSHGARFVMVGLQKEKVSFSHPEFHKRELTLMSSRNALSSDFEMVAKLFQKQQIDSGSFITKRIGFSEVGEKFVEILAQNSQGIKTVVEFD